MLRSFGYNLTRLARFSGRESAGCFWPYAGLIIILIFIGMAGLTLPILVAMLTKMQKFAAEHPDQATVESGNGSYSISIHGYHPELFPDLNGFYRAFGAAVAVIILLLGSAVARRLHDRGRSGFWGLLPLPFLGFGLFAMAAFCGAMINGGSPDMRIFGAMFLNNLFYLGSLLFLVVQLAGGGTPGPNRYGDASDQ